MACAQDSDRLTASPPRARVVGISPEIPAADLLQPVLSHEFGRPGRTAPPPRRTPAVGIVDPMTSCRPARWARLGTVLLVAIACGGPEVLPRGRQELAVVAKDPVLRFRATETELDEESRKAATEIPDFGGSRETPTEIVQVFRMGGDPAATVGAYRMPAEAAGWRLEWEGCSRAEQATGAFYRKDFPSFQATLALRAQLATSPGAKRRDRHLSLVLAVTADRRLPVDAGHVRNHLDCLRGLNPADLSLQPPSFPRPFSAQRDVCHLLGLEEAGTIVPEVDAVGQPGGDGSCQYTTDSGLLVFYVAPADRPRAYYEDRQVGTANTSELLYRSGYGPDRLGAWVQTPAGPLVVVKPNPELQPYVSGEQLLSVAAALAR